MICFSRRPGDYVVIDGKIEIHITSVRGDNVKLAIRADGLTVDRHEIHLRRMRGQPATVRPDAPRLDVEDHHADR